MSNNYNVTVPSGAEYPTQEFVDGFLNSIDALPTCDDLDKLVDMGTEAAAKFVQEQLNAAIEKCNEFFNGVADSAERQLEPIKPLTEAPDDIDKVLTYLQKVADYFAGPYNKVLNMTKFYLSFGAAAATALGNKANKMSCFVGYTPPAINIPLSPPEE